MVAAIVEQLLSDGPSDGIKNEDSVDLLGDEDICLSFDENDADRLSKIFEKIVENLPDLIHRMAESASVAMLRKYERDWASWWPSTNTDLDQFRANLESRWEKGFTPLRMLIELSRDIGVAFHERAARSRSSRRANFNTALVHLHARAIQISSEIMTLMENGFADGAMARWRTLHEVACVAMLVHDGGEALAKRYLAHEIVEARKGLRQYQQCHAALGYTPFSTREAKRIERDYDDAILQYGKDFGTDYGWAAVHLGILRPSFSQIEDAAGRAMMRSHYKMASHNVHASTKGIAYRLGAFDRHFAGLAGRSNVGFVEPGQNLALSLLHITSLMLPRGWTADKVALLMALTKLEERVPLALAQAERKIRRDERRIRREAAKR